jgi:hypothetical protein
VFPGRASCGRPSYVLAVGDGEYAVPGVASVAAYSGALSVSETNAISRVETDTTAGSNAAARVRPAPA